MMLFVLLLNMEGPWVELSKQSYGTQAAAELRLMVVESNQDSDGT